jgi:hypothetical protein
MYVLCSTLCHYYLILLVIYKLLDLCFFNILFIFIFLFCMLVFYSVYSVFLYFLCIVSPFVYSCLFPIFVQVYRTLSPGGNPTAVNKYHIISITHTETNAIYSRRITVRYSRLISTRNLPCLLRMIHTIHSQNPHSINKAFVAIWLLVTNIWCSRLKR